MEDFERFGETDQTKIEKVYSKSVKAYGIDLKSPLKHEFDNTVLKVRALARHRRYFVLERHKSHLKIVDSANFHLLALLAIPKHHQNTPATILDFELSEAKELVGTLISERKFFFWSLKNCKAPLLIGETDVLMDSIWRLEQADLWVTCSSTNCSVKLWRLAGGSLEDVSSPIEHTQEVTSIFYVLPADQVVGLKMVLTTSMDGSFKLWDLAKKAQVFNSLDFNYAKDEKFGTGIVGSPPSPRLRLQPEPERPLRDLVLLQRSDGLEPAVLAGEPLHRQVHQPREQRPRLQSAQHLALLPQH